MKNLLVVFFALILFASCTSKKETAKAVSPNYDISLAQWSLHKSFFGDALNGDWAAFSRLLKENPDSLLQGKMNPNDFPKIAASLGFKTIELVNTFYFSKAKDLAYWEGFKRSCDSSGVKVGLIMCDALGDMGNADSLERIKTVENHKDWVNIAKLLGAHSIRVNAGGAGTAKEVAKNAANGLSMLGKYGAEQCINVIVENHGSYSSNGAWLAGVMKSVNMTNVGTLPDFGNFCIERGTDGCVKDYDKYKGMEELMPYAKGVSAKSYKFDASGNELEIDYNRIFDIIKKAGFKGTIGIEYEGEDMSEEEGIKATKTLVEKFITK